MSLPPYVTYVYFKPNRTNSEFETESEKYLSSLQSNLNNLNTKRKFSDEILNEIISLYISLDLAQDFSQMAMPFIANLDHSQMALIDYDCSVIDVEFRIQRINVYFVLNMPYNNYTIYTAPSIHAIIFVLILFIKELREKLNSKLLMIYCIDKIALASIIILMFEKGIYFKDVNNIPMKVLANFVALFQSVWLSIIAYDYLVAMR